jgi:mono-ADP-ribosyltransferase sirtuin 6
MSEGYASRLSEYRNKGVCGLPESFDTKRALIIKLKRLGDMVAASQHFVIMTGAGISTSAGIPDFRGPQGVWTLEKETKRNTKKPPPLTGKDKKTVSQSKRKRQHDQSSNAAAGAAGTDFSKAHPTLTHRAIAKLAHVGTLKFCITQNVDGLHRRSGLSRNHHAALHGCAFTEICASCQTEHFRDQDVGGMSFQPTGRICGWEGCQGKLHDTLLDWEDALPEADFERAEQECNASDLVLCLGTSLRIEPAGSLPTRAKQFVICNLQITPKDDESALIIRAPVDEVMDYLMKYLGHEDWEKEDPLPIERIWKLKTG